VKKSLLAVVIALVLTGCAQAPQSDGGTPSVPVSGGVTGAFMACLVTGADDSSVTALDQLAQQGLTQAAQDLGIAQQSKSSTDPTAYQGDVETMVTAGCGIVIGVGSGLADAISQTASAHPDVKFAIVGASPSGLPVNVKPITFSNQASFMAGYVAAALSATGKVAEYGAQQTPDVIAQMDGFAQGVSYFDKQYGASVKLLGWDSGKQTGSFISSDTPYSDVNASLATANSLVKSGADVLFAVAGPAGEGALKAAQNSKGKVSAIWYGSDGCGGDESGYCAVMPTSVDLAADVAVHQVVSDAASNQFATTPYIGTLANKGVALAPWRDWAGKLGEEFTSGIDDITKKVSSGAITVK